MIVAIHQPNYIPWLGFFDKILTADVFVFLDHVQFSRGSVENRNRIKTTNGAKWLTQPVHRKDATFPPMNEVELADSTWKNLHLKTISQYYTRANAYANFFHRIQQAYLSTDTKNLVDFNIDLIQHIASWLGLTSTFVRASSLEVNGSSTALLTNICQVLGADIYLSGIGAKQYLDERVFEEVGINVIYSNFQHPTYSQPWGDFVPNLSILDLLLNCGEESLAILSEREAVSAR